jgi:hypothetical protein
VKLITRIEWHYSAKGFINFRARVCCEKQLKPCAPTEEARRPVVFSVMTKDTIPG